MKVAPLLFLTIVVVVVSQAHAQDFDLKGALDKLKDGLKSPEATAAFGKIKDKFKALTGENGKIDFSKLKDNPKIKEFIEKGGAKVKDALGKLSKFAKDRAASGSAS